MIDQNSQYNQLPKELDSVFSELEMNKHLRKARIKKSFGFSCSYLFRLVFCLIFQHKNWFSLLESKKADKFPAKDAVYRFLNHSTFMPIDFSLLSSNKAQINGISDQIDKRTCGYKRRKNALQSAPEQIPDMIKRALANGIDASYVLMDTWFTLPPLVKAVVEQGLDVIGMVKETKQRYNVNGKMVSLKQLYRLADPVQSRKGILRSIHTMMANGITVKVVFIQNRNKKSEWLAILSTDCTLSEQESIQIYGMRWDIEVFFKTTKSLLKLQKEFQSRSYDGMISHTTIVFARFIVLSWQNRCNTDQRTIGGLFYELCDEVNELDWAVALQQLIELLQDALKKTNKKIKNLIQSQLKQWISGLPSYIKGYLPISLCES